MGAQTDYSNEELPTCEIPACITTLMIDQGQDSLEPRHQRTGETEPDAQTAAAATFRCSSSQAAPLVLLFPGKSGLKPRR